MDFLAVAVAAFIIGALVGQSVGRALERSCGRAVTDEQYVFTVRPAGKQVEVTLNCVPHVWLRHLASLEPMGAEQLVMEVLPENVEQARKELTREADRLVRALQAAWEHGWRPT